MDGELLCTRGGVGRYAPNKAILLSIKRTESTLRHKSTGRVFKVTKGAPHILQILEPESEATVDRAFTLCGP